MTSGDQKTLLRAAIAAVRDCAETMETQAESLLLALPELSMNEELRPAVLKLSSVLKDTASRVTFELALLQAEIREDKADAAAVVRRLSNLDSTLMTVLDGSTDVASQLEKAADQDEDNELAFALVMQATEVMLQRVGNARAATQLLRPAVPRAPASSRIPPPPVRVAADGSVVILQAGAEGGDVTLVGRTTDAGSWAFARVTDDQTEALFGESGDGVVEAPSFENLEWVETWEEGLRLMDRYPWVRLYPLYVHPEFVERVRAAVEERLVQEDVDVAERARGKWERLFSRGGQGL